MQHYNYVMQGNAPAPAGGGDTKSWFEYYKLGTGADTFVPFTAEQLPEDSRPESGDYLWFYMDGVLIGVTKITGVLVDQLNSGTVEVYYDSDKVLPLCVPDCFVAGRTSGKNNDATERAWYTGYLQTLVIDR